MAAALPSGTVTFLFSDIEGSTQLLLRLGDTYAGILGEYQRLMRQAFTDHGGVEVDTQGDSFFAAFPTAASAVAAAAAATRALAEHPWPERGTVLAEVSAGLDLLFNYVRCGDAVRAEQIVSEVTQGVEHAKGSHGWLWRLRFAQARAELAYARGEWEEALLLAEHALQLGRDVGRVKYQALALRTHGQALAALGRGPEAHIDLRNALEIARGIGDPALFVQVAAASLGVEGDEVLMREAQATAQRISLALPNDEMRQAFEAANPVRKLAAPLIAEPVTVNTPSPRAKRRWWPWGQQDRQA